ncbi:hypothetical protein E2C01_008655 [Portunus trituberculatus]|uniref:Uncharacterized protein n=1 Tax=Portunus trituberculatus TaxID=210409 RepID=A0A5B7D1C7_PORTR|nr:hypothetical protein [Portunus trituberculatus]
MTAPEVAAAAAAAAATPPEAPAAPSREEGTPGRPAPDASDTAGLQARERDQEPHLHLTAINPASVIRKCVSSWVSRTSVHGRGSAPRS